VAALLAAGLLLAGGAWWLRSQRADRAATTPAPAPAAPGPLPAR
jgi:hypothetical protein